MDAAGTSIDYERVFSLPFGLAPTVDAAYVNGLDADTGYAFYLRKLNAPKWPPERMETSGIPFADGSGTLELVPASTSFDFGAAITLTRNALTQAQIELVGNDKNPPPADGFRWDSTAAQTGAVPLPAYDDGALVMRWRPAAAGTLGGTVSDGILESYTADHLLPTHATGGDGETTRDLLRAPVLGMVRFERYRHLELKGMTLSLSDATSTTGAIVIRSRAGGKTPPTGPLGSIGKALLIFENVDRQSAVNCIGRMAWCALIHRDDVRGTVVLKAGEKGSEGLIVQSYFDFMKVARAMDRPAMTDPLPQFDAATLQPFDKAAPKPTDPQIKAVVDKCLTTLALRDSLREFVTTIFAEIAAGASWSEIGCTTIGGNVAPPAALKDAHARLKALQWSTQTWVPCFAGAPVGQAAAVKAGFLEDPAASAAAQETLTPFHLEALTAAGQTAPTTEDFGSLAAFRVVDIASQDPLLTTRDFLDAIVKGSNTAVSLPPPIDFGPLAALNHPFGTAVDWPRFQKGGTIRTNLDTLRTTNTARGPSIQAANLGFWIDRTNLLQANMWPQVAVGNGPPELPPTPAFPYATRATRAHFAASGYDEYDLEAVLRARSVVRDARSGNTDIPVPLFLALLDRESYRSLGDFSRMALRLDNPDIGAGNPPSLNSLRVFSLQNWLSFPFGLDILIRGNPNNNTGAPLQAGSVAQFGLSFPAIHAKLVNLNLLASDLEPLLTKDDCLDYLALRRAGRLLPPTGDSMFLRSRSALWMAIALQMAAFQWIHYQLAHATGTRNVTADTDDEWVAVDEYVSNPPPPPGADANTDERRRFLGYWSLVYLGFNTSPKTWNRWVNSVPDPVVAAGTPISTFLTDRRNSAPRVVDGAGIGQVIRSIGQRGHQVRFAAGLDAYMRLGIDGTQTDTLDPQARAWAP